MQKMTRIILVFFLFVPNFLPAQDHVVYGVVHAFDSIPLIGAEIKVKSTKRSVLSDATGSFVIYCNSDDKLKIMASGFGKQNVTITKKIKFVAVNLKSKTKKQSPVHEKQKYAIGYGYVSERDKTTASASLRKNEASFSRYSDMYDLIRGQFAGVEISNGEIIIRGSNSFNSSSAALIVVDGVIMESDILNILSPVQIKNIHVIKDGSAAVYGSRGANGVVLIETKVGGDIIY
jgi:TonB-dependent SusC/RagA subfamily outer membrane receptor